MREFMGLYRGKRMDNGEWVEGWLIVNRVTIDPEEPEMIYCYILAYGKGESYVTWFPVGPDTVGECTGLRDKNGKLIFEGDIVQYYGTYALKICIENGHAIFGWRDEVSGFDCSELFFGHDDDYGEVEIIGNVHDNPELLKGGEQ